jgi:hypothetical protein
MTHQLVTYGQFAGLAKAQGWTAQFLAEKFRGNLEKPAEFFHRVLDSKSAEFVITYRSVMDFYLARLQPAAADPAVKRCACGCNRPVFGRKKLATVACRKRVSRERSVTRESGVERLNKDKAFSVTTRPDPGVSLNVGLRSGDGA